MVEMTAKLAFVSLLILNTGVGACTLPRYFQLIHRSFISSITYQRALGLTIEKQQKATTGLERYYLSKKEITALKKEVKKGSSKAARRPSDYYGLYLRNDRLFFYWLEKAAKLGDSKAKETLEDMRKK